MKKVLFLLANIAVFIPISACTGAGCHDYSDSCYGASCSTYSGNCYGAGCSTRYGSTNNEIPESILQQYPHINFTTPIKKEGSPI